MWELGLSLGVLAVCSFATRDKCVVLVALALLANWCINAALARMIGNDFPWEFYLGSDYLTGILILFGMSALCDEARIGPIVIALSYVFECVAHVSYGVGSQNAMAQYEYWWLIFEIAISQAIIVLVWGSYELVRSRCGFTLHIPSRFSLRKGGK